MIFCFRWSYFEPCATLKHENSIFVKLGRPCGAHEFVRTMPTGVRCLDNAVATYVHSGNYELPRFARRRRYLTSAALSNVRTSVRTYVQTYARTNNQPNDQTNDQADLRTYLRTYVRTYVRTYSPTYVRILEKITNHFLANLNKRPGIYITYEGILHQISGRSAGFFEKWLLAIFGRECVCCVYKRDTKNLIFFGFSIFLSF